MSDKMFTIRDQDIAVPGRVPRQVSDCRGTCCCVLGTVSLLVRFAVYVVAVAVDVVDVVVVVLWCRQNEPAVGL